MDENKYNLIAYSIYNSLLHEIEEYDDIENLQEENFVLTKLIIYLQKLIIENSEKTLDKQN